MKSTHKLNARAADNEQNRRMEDLRGEKSSEGNQAKRGVAERPGFAGRGREHRPLFWMTARAVSHRRLEGFLRGTGYLSLSREVVIVRPPRHVGIAKNLGFG